MIHFIMKNMKKGIKYLLSILVLSGILVSCKDDEEVCSDRLLDRPGRDNHR